MKKIFIVFSIIIFVFGFVSFVQADGCYICENGDYVKYKGEVSEGKKREAVTCGCHVVGTVSPCKVKTSKILCVVKNDPKKNVKNAVKVACLP